MIRFVELYEIQWTPMSQSLKKDGYKVYKGALAQGISDLLTVFISDQFISNINHILISFRQNYVEDVSLLEEYVVSNGPIPISFIMQHLQKVYSIDVCLIVTYRNRLYFFNSIY